MKGSLLNWNLFLAVFTVSFPGLDRSAFDNKVVSFDEHINSEHNMWHYLYFTVLLKVKDTTEFTGPESYVSQMVKVRHECKEDSLGGKGWEARLRVKWTFLAAMGFER